MKKILLKLLGLPLILVAITPLSVQAYEVRQIQLEEYTPRPVTLLLPPGQGITIDYRQVGQTIETIWVDNKRYIGVSTDGNILGNGSDPASALHLNLIESSASSSIEKTDRSLITVITVDQQKRRRYFLYSVFPNTTVSNDDSTKLIEYIMPTQITIGYDATRLVRNIRIMTDKGLIRDPSLIGRINQLISLINQGKNIEEAAKEAQVSMRFINSILAQN